MQKYPRHSVPIDDKIVDMFGTLFVVKPLTPVKAKIKKEKLGSSTQLQRNSP
jgi:hypothetical protein